MILERVAGQRYSRVLPLWRDYAVAIIAGGPSLTEDQVAQVGLAREADRLRVIAVNDAYLLAPWADLHYAADGKWHRWHAAGIAKPALGLTAEQVRTRWAAFAGERCSIQSAEEVVDERVRLVRNAHHPDRRVGLSLDPGAVVAGMNSGFQALNIAVLAGSRTIILLGFDCRADKDGRTHWHGGHPHASSPAAWKAFLRGFSAAEGPLAEAGVSVLNCSPDSAIASFPKVPLAAALDALP